MTNLSLSDAILSSALTGLFTIVWLVLFAAVAVAIVAIIGLVAKPKQPTQLVIQQQPQVVNPGWGQPGAN